MAENLPMAGANVQVNLAGLSKGDYRGAAQHALPGLRTQLYRQPDYRRRV